MGHRNHWGKYPFAVSPCVSGQTADRMAQAAGLAAGKGRPDVEDTGMQIVYQLAKRSIVKVTVKDAAGSGMIWKIEEDGIVIVSNRHLLMRDVAAGICFGNGTAVAADIIGYSQQYDIGFARIQEGAVTDSVLRDIYEAVPVLYETDSEEAKAAFGAKYYRSRVLQVGAAMDRDTVSLSTGNIVGLAFVPLFNTDVLVTECFSKAGMSGGGVFDEGGHFLGMISGGEVPEDAETREAGITYSIPPSLIQAEYEMIISE